MIHKLLVLLRSIWFNFQVLPVLQAIKIPILIDTNVRIVSFIHKGTIIITPLKLKPGMIKIGLGYGSFDIARRKHTILNLKKDATIIFSGIATIGRGTSIKVDPNAKLTFGNNFSCNANCLLSCSSTIVFEDDVTLGWNVSMFDWDGHNIVDIIGEQIINKAKPIKIGKGSWLCANSTITKGVVLEKENIVPFGSIITKSNDRPFCIYGGIPNRILKENVARKDQYKTFIY